MQNIQQQPVDKSLSYRKWKHFVPGAVALAGNAGFVNSVVLAFFDTPVSHMTGAFSSMGIYIVERQKFEVLEAVLIIVGFLMGSILAGILIGADKKAPSRRYGGVLMLQGVLILAASILLFNKMHSGLTLAAIACGLQNGMSTNYCGQATRTSHITGTVTDFGMMIGHWLRQQPIDMWKFRFLLALLLSFGTGAIIGTLSNAIYGPLCLIVSAVGCFGAGAIFYGVMSFKIRRQKEQSLQSVLVGSD